jgi:hypothetical protein
LTAQDAAALLLNLVNRERVAAGRPPLTSRDDLVRVAAAHSAGMAQRGQIFHNDLLFTAQVKSRLGARSVGENVAVNASAEDAHRRLMASPGHRANILNSQFRLAGIAVVNRAGSWYVTETFVSPVAGGVGQQGAARQRTPVGATSDDRLGTEPVAPAPTMAAAPTSTQDSTPSTIAPPRRAHTSGGVPFLTVLFAMVLVGLTTRGAGRELRRVLAPTAAHASSGPQPGLRATMPVGFLQY